MSSRERKNGKIKYILQYGVLYWGLTTAVLWSLLMHFLQPAEPWYVRPLIALIFFPAAGILFGLLTWKRGKPGKPQGESQGENRKNK